MATKAASKRLGKEAVMMNRSPPPYCYARPREDNVLEWHFILRGPPDTPYHGGEYWGQLIFPADYPFKPPGIKMSTPSGRFKPDTKICTSMSDFHPGSWNPAWSVSNILIGLLSFMSSDEMTTGSVMATDADRRTLATRSHAWNSKQKRFTQLFPEYSGEEMVSLPNMGEREQGGSSSGAAKAGATSVQTDKVRNSGEFGTQPMAAASASARADVAPQPPLGVAREPEEEQRMQPQAQPQPQLQRQEQRGLLGLRQKIAFAIALVAYLFFSRLVAKSGGSAGTGTAG